MPNTPVTVERAFVADTEAARRQVVDAWLTTAQATYQATADLQNAALSSSLSLFDTAASAQRSVVSQWQATAQQVQQAGLEALRAQFRAATRLIPTA